MAVVVPDHADAGTRHDPNHPNHPNDPSPKLHGVPRRAHAQRGPNGTKPIELGVFLGRMNRDKNEDKNKDLRTSLTFPLPSPKSLFRLLHFGQSLMEICDDVCRVLDPDAQSNKAVRDAEFLALRDLQAGVRSEAWLARE